MRVGNTAELKRRSQKQSNHRLLIVSLVYFERLNIFAGYLIHGNTNYCT